ncbi:protein kinase superfamily protein [Artemisia annua]|uniref:Protein kinase superfamily protein n=1 Tax=Artemisia annua TaxID=35608 RepID=A0A2U1N5K2_ARTAN|nr:protein kinase superfamily protein [Artemisia annua]
MGNSFGCSASGERLVSAARDGDLVEANQLSPANYENGISVSNINLSPSLLPHQPIYVRKNGFEHLKVRFMSMRASVVPSITLAHPPEPFMEPSTVPAPSPAPTIQGPVASPSVARRRHRHHLRHGKITHVIPPSPSPVPGECGKNHWEITPAIGRSNKLLKS